MSAERPVPRRDTPWGLPEGDTRQPKAHRCNEDVVQHVTDLSGRDIVVRITGGMKAKGSRLIVMSRHLMLLCSLLKMLYSIVRSLVSLCCTLSFVPLEATRPRPPDLVLSLRNLNLATAICTEDVTPVPTDSTLRKGGRRGRRLSVGDSPCYLPSLGTGLWVVLLFLCLLRGALILLYVEDHLLLVEPMMCMDIG